MTSPYPRLDVSKVGLLIGLALIAFGAYTLVAYFRPGGHGHAMTMLRAAVAIPLGGVAIFLSFSTVCSACGVALARREVLTTAAQSTTMTAAAAASDGAGLARAYLAARREPGPVTLRVEACPRCRRLVRVGARGEASRMVPADAAGPLADAVLADADSP